MSDLFRERAEKIRDGLTIFLKYSGCSVDAQHDIIYAGADEVSAEDEAKLEELGWHRDEDGWGFFT